MKKLTILSVLTVLAFVLIGTQKTYANTNNQIEIVHTLPNVPQLGATYELNGFNYKLDTGGSTLVASAITENPNSIEYIVVYEHLMDKPVSYVGLSSLSSYTNLKDVIIFANHIHFPGLYNYSGTIQNLYLGHGNNLKDVFENINITNYHFVTPYFNYYTEFDVSNGNAKIDEMNFVNGYYYDFTKDVFERSLVSYNQRPNKQHNFVLKSDSTLKYTKESFYPSKDFKLKYTTTGVDYEINLYTIKHNFYKSYLDMQVDVVDIDPRVKSFQGPKLINDIEPLRNIEFKTLDLRGYKSLVNLKNIKAQTLYLSNKGDTFNNNANLTANNLYFVADTLSTPVGSVFGTYPNINNVYIPDNNKSLFQTIIDSDAFAGKIKYYTQPAPSQITYEFTNDEGTRTYKSSDDYVDIDTIINSTTQLETLANIDLSNDYYINQTLETFGFPIYHKNSGLTIEAYPLHATDIHLNKGMDPRVVLEKILPEMIIGEYNKVEIEFEEGFKLDKDGELDFNITLNDRLTLSSRLDVYYHDFKDNTAFVKFSHTIFVLTQVSSSKNLEDLFDIYNEHVDENYGEAELNKNHTLSQDKTALSSYDNDFGSHMIKLIVTKDNLADKFIYYELPDSFIFTSNIDIEKAIEELHSTLILKDDVIVSENYTVTVKVNQDDVNLKGTYPNGKTFNVDIPYTIIESEIGEYIIAKHDKINAFTLYVEARTIKEDVNAQSILDLYFESQELEKYKDKYELPITLTKKGELTKTVKLTGTEEEFTVRVVVTGKDLNPEDFKDPFKTNKDEFGSSSILDQIKDKLGENDALKWSSIVVSSLLGIGLIYLVYLFIRKLIKWVRK